MADIHCPLILVADLHESKYAATEPSGRTRRDSVAKYDLFQVAPEPN